MYVEYISTHQQRIWLMLHAPSRELIEEVLMLINAVIILINDLSEVKVCSMKYLHESCLFQSNNCLNKWIK